MEAADDETQEGTEEPQDDASEINSDHSNVTILLNNSRNAQIPNDNTIQMVKRPKATELTAARKILQKYSNRVQQHSSTHDNNEIELEVDLIVVNDKETTDQTTESNENEHENEETPTNHKRLRLEVEPLINQPNESSPNEEEESKSPAVPKAANQSQSQPRKSIEEIVSSSEAFDTNSEDKYFALSILGTLRRLTPHKRALAKCHILSYLTEIEYGNSNSTT